MEIRQKRKMLWKLVLHFLEKVLIYVEFYGIICSIKIQKESCVYAGKEVTMRIIAAKKLRRQPKKLSNGELNVLIVEKNDQNIHALTVDRRQLRIWQILSLRRAGFKVKKSPIGRSLRIIITW